MNTVISRDGTPIAFDRQGTGAPIILVDGALCCRTFGPMPKLAPILAQRFTVFHYDRRGRGQSGDTAPYMVEREVEDIAALIAEAGGSANVLGLSSGAALALAAAASGLNITKLALYEPPYIAGVKGGHQPPVNSEAKLIRILSAGRRGDAVKFFMTDMVGAPAIMAGIMQFTPVWKKLKAVAHTLPYDAAVMGNFTVPTKRAAEVHAPTLIMGGAKSPVGLQHAVDAVSGAIPNAKRLMLAGQTHNVSVKRLAPVVEEFFTCN
jgi:pimeloyl-ACP methyl ester carboxylesterase